MEEKKKLRTFDIVNICILGAALVLCIITNVSFRAPDVTVPIILVLTNAAVIIAIVSGIGYMFYRYSKSAAFLYKIYMYSFVAISFFISIDTMTNGTGSTFRSVLNILIPILSAILAAAKDYGKIKTYIIAGLLLLTQIVLFITSVGTGLPLLPFISQLILIIEAFIMVIGKYKDKAARGTK